MPATATDAYVWPGAQQRSADTLGGLILMGVRLYNPATGRFPSTDPVIGGGANRYSYPTDPIDLADTNGQCWWGWSCWRQHVASVIGGKVINLIAGLAGPSFCTAIGLGIICNVIVSGLASAEISDGFEVFAAVWTALYCPVGDGLEIEVCHRAHSTILDGERLSSGDGARKLPRGALELKKRAPSVRSAWEAARYWSIDPSSGSACESRTGLGLPRNDG